MIEQNFDLNLIPDSAPVVIHVDQYDTGAGRLVVSLYERDVTYTPASGATVQIQGTKPDGKGFLYDATISGNVVTADLTEQMTAVAGDVRTQIVVRETGGRTGTFVFFLRVQKSALPSDADMSESDLQAVERLIEAAEGIVDEATEAAGDAEAWAVGERGGVPVPSSDPAYQNNAEYWASVAALYSQGALKYQGSIPFSALPTSGMSEGDLYNITTDFTTDSRFAEGSGIKVKAGTNIAYDKNGKWDLFVVPMIPTMTATEQGIGRPDGMTADVTDGVFRAKGVAIYATVNASGTEYGADWLKYGNTVITPSNIQLYLVYIDGKPTLWGWDGTQYVMVSASGSGGLVSILQADFDALPAADKNDPEIWWWISDADGAVSSMGAGGGVTSYTELTNKPQINGVELVGNKTAEQLGITGGSDRVYYGVCTGISNQTISVSCEDFELSEGAVVVVMMGDYGYSGQVTSGDATLGLNVNSTGRIEVLPNQPETGYVETSWIKILHGSAVTFVYDGTRYIAQDTAPVSIQKDTTPTSGSTNAISSGGVYSALKSIVIARNYLLSKEISVSSSSNNSSFGIPSISGYTPIACTNFSYRNIDGGADGDMNTYGLTYKPLYISVVDQSYFYMNFAFDRQAGTGEQRRTFYFDMEILYIKSEYL